MRSLGAVAAAGLAAVLGAACSRDASRDARVGTPGSTRQALGAPIVSPEITFGGSNPPPQGAPEVVFNGQWWLAAWEETPATAPATWSIRTARVARDGSVLDATPRLAATFSSATAPYGFALASDDKGFLLAWFVNATLVGVTLDADGVPLDAQPRTLISWLDTDRVEIAGRAEGYLLVWTEPGGGEDCWTSQLVGARVTGDGVALDPTGFLIAVTDPFCYPGLALPAVAADSRGFLVGWGQRSSSYPSALRTVRVAPDGGMGTIHSYDACGCTPSPVLATGASGFLTAWDCQSAGVSAVALWSEGTVRSPEQPLAPAPAAWPSVAYLGGEYMVFGSIARSGATQLFAERVSESGAALDATPFPVVPTISNGFPETVASGDGCGHALVAYTRALPALPNGRVGLRLVTDTQIVSAGCPYPVPDAGMDGAAGNDGGAPVGSLCANAGAAGTDAGSDGNARTDASDAATSGSEGATSKDAAEAGSVAAHPQSRDQAGCGCRAGPARSPSSPWALVAFLLLLDFARREQRDRSRDRAL